MDPLVAEMDSLLGQAEVAAPAAAAQVAAPAAAGAPALFAVLVGPGQYLLHHQVVPGLFALNHQPPPAVLTQDQLPPGTPVFELVPVALVPEPAPPSSNPAASIGNPAPSASISNPADPAAPIGNPADPAAPISDRAPTALLPGPAPAAGRDIDITRVWNVKAAVAAGVPGRFIIRGITRARNAKEMLKAIRRAKQLRVATEVINLHQLKHLARVARHLDTLALEVLPALRTDASDQELLHRLETLGRAIRRLGRASQLQRSAVHCGKKLLRRARTALDSTRPLTPRRLATISKLVKDFRRNYIAFN
ncbi:hypothetical protein ACP70R_047755 [Stipagrostis hirtigluma subsp. patula]